MPYYYRFTDRTTGDDISLAAIDDELRKQTGWAPDPSTYCTMYTLITFVGLELAMIAKEDGITSGLFEQWKAQRLDRYDAEEWALIEQYLIKDYQFKVHYGRKLMTVPELAKMVDKPEAVVRMALHPRPELGII